MSKLRSPFGAVPDTSCLATIVLSLRDKIHSTAEAKREARLRRSFALPSAETTCLSRKISMKSPANFFTLFLASKYVDLVGHFHARFPNLCQKNLEFLSRELPAKSVLSLSHT